MADVLIYADSLRSPEMRHEVPIAIPDPFLYAEREGRRHVVASSFELGRISEVAPHLEVLPLEEFGIDELYAQGLSRDEIELEVILRAARRFGIEDAVVPATFPLEAADHLRANGIQVKADREQFVGRRRVKNVAELAGIRRAQRAAEAAMDAARKVLRSAQRQNGNLVVDGEQLTCERIKLAVEQAFTANGAFADEFIVSHGEQTAVGHDMGSGPIAPDEPVCLDLFPRDRESGCFADMTRVFVVGTPSDELLEYHKLCLEALERSVAAVKPGVPGSELHKISCDVFEEHGYPTLRSKQPGEVLQDGFYHSLGHGVGLEVHEEPSLGRGPGELVAGDVIAVEPGLYRNGYGGCRLEDLVLVTENGGEVLTDYPYDLEP
ncbi:MAG TPA: Xaa-Pro peptidase family protein [Gaiellaceae bacterium]|jgi:Xaa-Pro aminopeptidase|nr:Xaa-Pro peptidase family protein [Gaiellaceae bacterium]